MADDPQDPKFSGGRPLDPTKNAEDLMGEEGATGVTTGGTQQTSATPGDVPKDESVVRGGVIDDPTKVPAERQDPTEYSDSAYNQQTLQGMSGARKQMNNDQASGEEKGKVMQELPDNQTGEDPELRHYGNATQADAEKNIMAQEAPFTNNDNLGVQDAAGGSESAPESDDDAGDMLERTGTGVDKDGEDPQEVSIADAVDKAEDAHLHS